MGNIVITGTTGMDGSILSKQLLDQGHTIVAVVRRTSSPDRWRWRELGLEDYNNFLVCSGDLTDQSSIDRVIKEYQPAQLYNLAAQSFVGSSWNEPLSTLDITGLGAVRVFEAVRNHSPHTRVVQASSSEQIGGENRQIMFDENTPFEPRSPYAVAKCMAHYAAKVYRESFGLFICCSLMGNHEGPMRGEQFVTRKISQDVARIYLGLASELELLCLDSKRDWGFANDYCVAMQLMLEQDRPDDYVIATGKTRSIEDFCRIAFEHIGIKDWRRFVRLDEANQRPADVKYLCGNASKARDTLGWCPTMPFDNLVVRMVDKDIERLRK